MKGILVEPDIDLVDDARSRGLTIGAALIAAVLVTGLVFAGYAYLRKRNVQQALSAAQAQQSSTQSNGPSKAEIYVDDAMLKGDQTIIGGTVKNISSDNLIGLSVDLELKRRKDGAAQKTSVQVQPTQLAPQQEGRYSLQVLSADYSSVKLIALKTGSGSSPLAYTPLPGQKRPPEKLESKTIIVNRPAPSKDTFLNTPDNPGRVP
jgi:hypothetical protein